MRSLTLNLEEIGKIGISVCEYLSLYDLYYHTSLIGVPSCLPYLDSLQGKGFVKQAEQGWELRNKAIELFETRDIDAAWFEFKSVYPIKVGLRRLHDQQDKCKYKYQLIIKNKPELHDNIIKSLSKEMELRRQAGMARKFFPEPKIMSAYINQRAWETYFDTESDEAGTLKGNTSKVSEQFGHKEL